MRFPMSVYLMKEPHPLIIKRYERQLNRIADRLEEYFKRPVTAQSLKKAFRKLRK